VAAVRILVCDNEPALRALVRATLEGYEIVEAKDGDESVELAASAEPDLVILDMMMPGRTGLEVIAELRADPAKATLPVVMLTARAQAGDRAAAESAGANRFLTKPFSPAELLQTVEELLKQPR
jgi:CheY-like chemotaxis protein